jgi:hypothetical protein
LNHEDREDHEESFLSGKTKPRRASLPGAGVGALSPAFSQIAAVSDSGCQAKLRAAPGHRCIAAEMSPGNAETLLYRRRGLIVTVPGHHCIVTEKPSVRAERPL